MIENKSFRATLIDAIIEHAGDEYEKKQDYIDLAKQSQEELLNNLLNILNWYRNG
jgi:hypothetical protein